MSTIVESNKKMTGESIYILANYRTILSYIFFYMNHLICLGLQLTPHGLHILNTSLTKPPHILHIMRSVTHMTGHISVWFYSYSH
jgi:hypothetical protein